MYLVRGHAGRLLRRRAGLHRRRRRQGRTAGHDAEPGRLLQRRRPDRHDRDHGRRELRRDATRCTSSSAISPTCKADHPALRSGAQVQRYSTNAAGIFAFSRIDAAEGIEYVVALNNAETAKTQAIQTYSADAAFSAIWPAGGAGLTSNGAGQLSITVPPLSAVVYRADAALAPDTTAPTVNDRQPGRGRRRSSAGSRSAPRCPTPDSPKSRSRSRPATPPTGRSSAPTTTPPIACSTIRPDLAEGTPLTFKAVVRDASGNLDSDTGTAVVGAVAPPPSGGGTPDYAVVHYLRPAADYDGWGFHFWGDIDQTVEWTSPVPLAGEDAYGPFAWVKLLPNADEVGFIPHKGDEKDPGPDRFFNPSQNPEIWLKQGDLAVYTSRADAQGYAEIHYHRPDGVLHRLGPAPVGRRHRPERGDRVGHAQATDGDRRLRRLLEGPDRRTPRSR